MSYLSSHLAIPTLQASQNLITLRPKEPLTTIFPKIPPKNPCSTESLQISPNLSKSLQSTSETSRKWSPANYTVDARKESQSQWVAIDPKQNLRYGRGRSRSLGRRRRNEGMNKGGEEGGWLRGGLRKKVGEEKGGVGGARKVFTGEKGTGCVDDS